MYGKTNAVVETDTVDSIQTTVSAHVERLLLRVPFHHDSLNAAEVCRFWTGTTTAPCAMATATPHCSRASVPSPTAASVLCRRFREAVFTFSRRLCAPRATALPLLPIRPSGERFVSSSCNQVLNHTSPPEANEIYLFGN